jgi:hypothetical protein
MVDIETLIIKRHCNGIPTVNGNGNGNVYGERIPVWLSTEGAGDSRLRSVLDESCGDTVYL